MMIVKQKQQLFSPYTYNIQHPTNGIHTFIRTEPFETRTICYLSISRIKQNLNNDW